MLNSQEEIEQAEQILESMETQGKVAVLAMVENRIVSMLYMEKYSDCPACMEALQELHSWIRFPITEELARLGTQTEIAYVELPTSLKTIELDALLMENSKTKTRERNEDTTIEEIEEHLIA